MLSDQKLLEIAEKQYGRGNAALRFFDDPPGALSRTTVRLTGGPPWMFIDRTDGHVTELPAGPHYMAALLEWARAGIAGARDALNGVESFDASIMGPLLHVQLKWADARYKDLRTPTTDELRASCGSEPPFHFGVFLDIELRALAERHLRETAGPNWSPLIVTLHDPDGMWVVPEHRDGPTHDFIDPYPFFIRRDDGSVLQMSDMNEERALSVLKSWIDRGRLGAKDLLEKGWSADRSLVEEWIKVWLRDA